MGGGDKFTHVPAEFSELNTNCFFPEKKNLQNKSNPPMNLKYSFKMKSYITPMSEELPT